MTRSVLHSAVAAKAPVDPRMVKSHEGGSVFTVSLEQSLLRTLIMGTSAGTLYQSPETFTGEAVDLFVKALSIDPRMTIGITRNVAQNNRAPRPDMCILLLAVALNHEDLLARKLAADFTKSICKTASHLEMLASFVLSMRPRGAKYATTPQVGRLSAVKKRAFRSWFDTMDPANLAYQAIKYPERNGVSLRDILIMTHPNGGVPVGNREHRMLREYRKEIYNWIVKGTLGDAPRFKGVGALLSYHEVHREKGDPDQHPALRIVAMQELYRQGMTENHASWFISQYNLPREVIPTELLNSEEVWAALLKGMPIWAMLRNLGKMSAIGLLKHRSLATDLVVNRLLDKEYIRKSKVHPWTIYVAMRSYSMGKGVRGKLVWQPVQRIVDALDAAFDTAFGNVKPTLARTLVAVDVSGSMDDGKVAGNQYISCREAAAVMAMAISRVEPNCTIVAYSDRMVPIDIDPNDRIDVVMRKFAAIPMGGGTYCSLPIEWALKEQRSFDCFISITDSETHDLRHAAYYRWPARLEGVRPKMSYREALLRYRNKLNPMARAATMAMAANEISLSDPDDPMQLDLVGLDASSLAILREFQLGWDPNADVVGGEDGEDDLPED